MRPPTFLPPWCSSTCNSCQSWGLVSSIYGKEEDRICKGLRTFPRMPSTRRLCTDEEPGKKITYFLAWSSSQPLPGRSQGSWPIYQTSSNGLQSLIRRHYKVCIIFGKCSKLTGRDLLGNLARLLICFVCVCVCLFCEWISCVPSWLWTHYIALDDMEFLILPPLPPEWQDHKYELPCLVYVMVSNRAQNFMHTRQTPLIWRQGLVV